jgi:hypothetical protein
MLIGETNSFHGETREPIAPLEKNLSLSFSVVSGNPGNCALWRTACIFVLGSLCLLRRGVYLAVE